LNLFSIYGPFGQHLTDGTGLFIYASRPLDESRIRSGRFGEVIPVAGQIRDP